MSLNTELISAVRGAQRATDQAAVELERVKGMYMMTSEGIAEQRDKLFTASRELSDAAKRRGLDAIETACATLDAQERAEGEHRAADLAYMQRLESKLNIAKGMKSDMKDEAEREKLGLLFGEFAGDSLAVTVIRQTLGADKAFFFLPEDNTGKRQQHLKAAVKKLFERAMDKAGCNPASYSINPEFRSAELDAFCEYCNAQDEFFSRPDREVWQQIHDARPADGSVKTPEFDMRMMSL